MFKFVVYIQIGHVTALKLNNKFRIIDFQTSVFLLTMLRVSRKRLKLYGIQVYREMVENGELESHVPFNATFFIFLFMDFSC